VRSTTLKVLFKQIIRKIAWTAKKKTISQILLSRCRRDGMPEHGRFTPREIEQIIFQANLNIKELMSFFNDLNNLGNYQNEYAGLIDLAIYRALVKGKIDRNYAMNLVGDMQWQGVVNAKGLIPIIDPLRKKLHRLTTKDPMAYLGKRIKAVMKYPYGEPGYKIELYMNKNVYCMDIYSCPVFDFYKQFGKEEMTLFRRTWCTFDYTSAEHIVDGGKYLRKHTLSDGDKVCDMRWFVNR
jgi:L-2-amino-thiazoline-4-carboxylic acid hydrolase